MRFNRLIVLAFLFILILNSCRKDDELTDGYLPIGKFANRTTAETEALKTLVDRFSGLPVSGYYKVIYEFDDVQLAPGLSGSVYHRHAIWYDKANGELGVEFDIYSGTSCRWNKVDQVSLQKIVDSKQGLEGANQLATPTGYQQNCFKQ
ncbi:hypothetical protein [Spirosoma utsteinense]|uniref:Lipoprotein n=1 Tax=Spirosoma utsteinense TaxID=2585773 RepID=A0ABR6WBU1_9BACT|nr:hypothetical protein [Spirosoma utsteinense]MBC3789436.1 hypothetical protein [Spirosoma utsteinense]MBC3794032.1 hypothetical protein [Spirosoma utsteinense]